MSAVVLVIFFSTIAIAAELPGIPDGWSEGFVYANGIRIHYYHAVPAPGKPVILAIHGVMDTGLTWASVANRLQDDYDIYMLDTRGHGLSDPFTASDDSNTMIEDVVEAAKALGLEKPILMGHSMGGAAVIRLGAEYPDLARAIIVVDAGISGRGRRVGGALGNPSSPPLPSSNRLAITMRGSPEALVAQNNYSFDDLVAKAHRDNPRWSMMDCRYWAIAIKRYHGPYTEELWQAMSGSMRGDNALAKIQVPTIILKADAPPETRQAHQEAASVMQNGKLVHIDDSAHNVQRDQPERAAQVIREFLSTRVPGVAEPARSHPDSVSRVITNDVFALDTSGNPIYAQGGGVFKFPDPETGVETYYWYGVKYRGAVTYQNDPSAGKNNNTGFLGFSCYSSTNLVDWKFENLSSEGLGGGWIGRMGVCYNENTEKYVLLSQSYPGVMFATCDTPNGTFVYHHTQCGGDLDFIVNNGTGDQTIFIDDDGTPYLIASSVSGRSHLYVLPLRESDYLEILPATEIYKGRGREGNCMFKYNGKYYFCSSDLHGWNTSHCYVLESVGDDIMGPYLPEYVMDRSDLDFCHVSQTGFFYTVKGTQGTTVLFVGDRWCDFAGNGVGFNQWCPLTFNGTRPTFNSVTAFNLDAAAGTWSVAPGNNYVLNPNYEADRVSQSRVAGWTSTGSGYRNASGSHNPGRWHFRHNRAGAYTATTHQLVTDLPNGTYTLSVWYKSSGGQPTAQIFARSFGSAELVVNVNTAQTSWQQVIIPKIPVTNGQCDVGLHSVANANQSVDVDDWSLTLVEPPSPGGGTAASR